uniref:Ig-like domain-containing protein n=1 Tax=Callorhinchus milii TaxID=7868 RepID=A0A4W3GZJ0_CALMI
MPDEDNRLRNVLNITANKSDDGQNYTCVAEIILESNNTMQIQTSSVTLQVNCKFLFSHKVCSESRKNGNSPFLSVNQLCICLFSCVNLFFFDKLTDAPTVGINKASEDWVEGKPQTVSCDVTGSPAPRLTWTKDGKPLSRERTLHIQSVHMDDAGLYTCTIIFLFLSSYFQKSPIQINNGDNVTLTCFSEANPSANLSWEYPHQSTNVKEYPSGILFISYANSGNSGIYKCRANNHHGTDVQKVEISSPIQINNGDNVTLTCFSEANPSANLSWEYPHQSTNVKEYPSGILFISYANSGNSGIYKCRAHNHHGTDVQKVEISVKG